MFFYFHKRSLAVTVFLFIFLLAVPAAASLPYYNQDLGYTIWLTDEWSEAPNAYLTKLNHFHDGVSAHTGGWKAGYTLKGGTASLLVSSLYGRVVSKASIGNFNSFVIRELKHAARNVQSWTGKPTFRLNSACFDAEKNMLRLAMDRVSPTGQRMTAIVYIAYTATSMLKFVGLAEPGDAEGVKAIDNAVATLYFDHGLRQ